MLRRRLVGFFALLALSSFTCAKSVRVRPKIDDVTNLNESNKIELGVRFVVLSSGYKVWTRRVGRGKTKVLLLSGGPGLSHDYLSCFESFLPKAGYEIYFYDQLGCGQSDKPADPSLWTIPRYLAELEEVRIGLGLEKFVIFGHSWGGILGVEYVLKYPDNVQAFILSNMTASFASYTVSVNRLRESIPTDVLHRMQFLESTQELGGKEYQDLMMQYLYSKYICRLDKWPETVTYSVENINAQIYETMQGPNEFLPSGNLKSWDRWDSLSIIDTPTLVMGSKYDEMSVDDIRNESKLIANSELFISEHGSHLAMWDDQFNYFSALLGFLRRHVSR